MTQEVTERWNINGKIVEATQTQIENYIHVEKQLREPNLVCIENLVQTKRFTFKIIPSSVTVEFNRACGH